jgi:CDC48 subfamily AAA family ATPase
MSSVKLKVMEAVQDDVNKGIVKVDSNFMKQVGVNPGDIVVIKGERSSAAIVDRAYPGDIGLNIIRMDGNIRRNARTSIGEMVVVEKAVVAPAKKISIAPAHKGVMIKASPQLFKQGLFGKALVTGDIVSLGKSSRRRVDFQGREITDIFSMMEEQFAGFGFGDIKFVVVDTNPKKEIVVVTQETQIEFNPQAVNVKAEEGISLGINYEDIGGLSDEITKVREMIELPLKHPEIFERLGIEAPKGVLLHGPPGTGKTLLAKAVASETNSHFILINGPEIISKFYGESEHNLRKKFEEAEQNAPSIIFLDEIDAIASKREEARGDVEKRVVAQMLGLMDGLKSRGKVIVIAATNMPNLLDGALRRPGRFDREIEIGVPDKAGRLDILKIHTRNMPILGSLYSNQLARIIPKLIEKRAKELSLDLEKSRDKVDSNKLEIAKLEKMTLNKSVGRIEVELAELEKKKAEADENVIYTLIEKIKNLNNEKEALREKLSENDKKITELKLENSDLENVEDTKSKLEAINFLKEEFSKQRRILMKLVDEIIAVEEAKYSLDPREVKVVEFSENYEKLSRLDVLPVIIEKARADGVEKDREMISKITHGFVGADLNALAKEAAMIVLRRILPELKQKGIEEGQSIPNEILEKLRINLKDFLESLKVVRPSAMREVFVETPDVNWSDIGGLDEVKAKLQEAVEWPLKRPEIFKRMGIRPPRGIMLYGPPGTGKTLLAKAVAKESEANFILVNGPSLLSKWVGESEKAVREIFRKARQTSPTILFFDEIDALVPKRSSSSESKVNERVVNQMLTEMDGLESLNDVVIIGATNRPDIVDTALLRQGRFDRVILTPKPDLEGRRKIFEIYIKDIPISSDVDIAVLAKKTDGYVGADIEGVCREAAMMALREDLKSKEVSMAHFKKALEIVRPSVTKEVEEAYNQLKDYFSSARGKEIKQEKASYVG